MTVLTDKPEVDRIDAALLVEELAKKLHYSLSTKDARQSSEGYPTKVDWLVEVRVIGTGWWHKV